MLNRPFFACGTLSVIIVLLNLSSVESRSVQSGSILPIDEYTDFFRLLSQDEQEWIMRLAVWYYDVDEPEEDGSGGGIGKPLPPPVAELKPIFTFPLRPLPSTNITEPQIPQKLVSHFLNGDVPRDWQKLFTKWLKKTYHLKKKNFEQYKANGTFCYKSDPCELVDLFNVGGICCPFG